MKDLAKTVMLWAVIAVAVDHVAPYVVGVALLVMPW